MAQQTINVGTAPNDGTGTPLRTAFQYTNSNFTELYTAIGPSGNNINVPGAATITGNLTVDTNTFFVDSANNRVGVGTASPAATFSVLIGSEFLHFGFGANNDNYYTVGSSGAHIWRNSGTEQMRLNSTGLGVGVSPSYNLDVRAAAATANVQSSTGTNAVSIVARNTGGSFTLGKENSVGGGSGVFGQDAYASVLWSTGAYPLVFGTNAAHRLQIDSVGNTIPIIQTTAPTLTLNGQMVFNLTSNTNLRISVRGTDGTTRAANITLF